MKASKMVTIFIIFVLFVLARPPSAQELVIHCVNIGHGDCTLIISPSGRTMMVDAGPPYNASMSHLYHYLDSLDIDTLDYFVSTHYDLNHIGGLDTLFNGGIVIDTLYDRGWWYCSQFYEDSYAPMVAGIRHTINDDQIIDLGDSVRVTVVCVNGNGLLAEPYVSSSCIGGGPNDENDFSIAVVVDYNDFRFFAGGDLTGYTDGGYRDIETSIASEVGDLEVYQVNQHGSDYSTNQFFLETIKPEVSVLSVGKNPELPDASVVSRLSAVSLLYQTQDSEGNDIDGDIVIRTGGFDFFVVNSDTILIPEEPQPVYYHAFENFDDDVDRVKMYTNFFGGDHAFTPDSVQIRPSYDTIDTRYGFGRSLKIEYGPLTSWGMFLESFDRKNYDNGTWLDFTDLFPDYADPDFQGRSIDSIVFYCKLIADNTLTLKLELHDAMKDTSGCLLDIDPSDEWQRFAVSPNQFSGFFDPARAKFIGFTFADNPNNLNESGVFYLDDIYLAETGYEKPVFASDLDMLEYINEVNFRYFWTAVDPVSKFALDRHTFTDLISVDAVGFQLTSYVVAHRRGWINQLTVEDRIEHILDYLLHTCRHADDTDAVKNDPLGYASVNGTWAHFLDNATLSRKDTRTEFSLFSNALLLSGVLVCREYFDSTSNIFKLADTLYRMTDWNFLYRPDDTLMCFGWMPESGYLPNYSDWFTEELDLAFLLGISTPELAHRLPANPFHASNYYRPECDLADVESYVYSYPGANFTYYFLQMYARYPLDKVDFVYRFENARNALLADVCHCRDEYSCLDYPACIFGTSACEGPDSAWGDNSISNYHAYGYACRSSSADSPNGTIAVYGGASAILFIPEQAINCLNYYYNEMDGLFHYKYGYNFWSPIFCFPDAFHLAPDACTDTMVNRLGFRGPWISSPRFGIDVGPMLINIDSYLSELRDEPSIRDIFSGNADIEPNLIQFDPIYISTDTEDDSSPAILPYSSLAQNYPNPFNISTKIEYSLGARSRVTITIFDILGRKVKTVIDREQPAGNYTAVWDGTDADGRPMSSGVYFYRIQADNLKESKKALLLK